MLNTIWNNTFLDKPIPKWDFKIQFIITDFDTTFKDYFDMLSDMAYSCTWPSYEGNLISTFYAGLEHKLPGRPTTSKDLTIKFYDNKYSDVQNFLVYLFNTNIFSQKDFIKKDNESSSYRFVNESSKPLYFDILVNVGLNVNNGQVYHTNSFKFKNCYLYKIDENELSYENEDEIITRTATFNYDYVED